MAQLARKGLFMSKTTPQISQIIPRRTASASLDLRAIALSKNHTPASTINHHQTHVRHKSTTPPRGQPTSSFLTQQRLRRPLSPHLTIYRPQITSVLSVLMRNTGLLMSGTFCLFPLLHLASPDLFSASALAASFGGLSPFVKVPIKTAAAWIFTFHALNSLRVVTWGFAKGVTNKRVAQTGWVVVGASFVSALALAVIPGW
ncbi:hypothetical protein Q7P37_010641 [Cladosporium fusiforme]